MMMVAIVLLTNQANIVLIGNSCSSNQYLFLFLLLLYSTTPTTITQLLLQHW